MCDMMAEEPIVPHCKPIIIRSIVMTPVPLFNKQRNGCRPFCEVYVGDERVLTTSQEYDRMKSVCTSGKVKLKHCSLIFPIDLLFTGILEWRTGKRRFPLM